MAAILDLLNAALRPLFDLVLLPFRQLHPMIGLTLVSLVCSMLMLIGYRATSNQPAIEDVKRKIAAGLFEIRLFNDDIVAILRAQSAILRHNLRYLGLNMVPMVFMVVPFVLVVGQLQFHYGYEGLDAGEPTLLQVTLDGPRAEAPRVDLQLPDGVRLDSDRVWMPTEGKLAWRLVVEEPGEHELLIGIDDETHTKSLTSSASIVRRSPGRYEPGLVNQVLYPAEPSLPGDSAVRAIEIAYPDRAVGLFGIAGHWLIAFFILTIAMAFALKGRFGVTI